MTNGNAEEELAFIKGIIQESRKTNFTSGAEYIAWGVLVPIGLIGTYILIIQQIFQLISALWVAVILAGWGFEIYYNIKIKKN